MGCRHIHKLLDDLQLSGEWQGVKLTVLPEAAAFPGGFASVDVMFRFFPGHGLKKGSALNGIKIRGF